MTYEPTEKLALHIHSWQVNANIFKVMRNVFLRDFFIFVVIYSATKNKNHENKNKNHEAMDYVLL